MKSFSAALTPAILWIVATAAGGILSVIPANIAGEVPYLVVPSGNPFYSRIYPISLPTIAAFLTVGAILSTVQWTVWRRFLTKAWVWIPITALAFPLSVHAFDLLGPPRVSTWILFLIPVSTVQWLYLRNQLQRSSSWIWVHSAMAILLFLLQQLPRTSEVDCCVSLTEMLAGGLLVGTVFGLPGAISIVIMFRHQRTGGHGAA